MDIIFKIIGFLAIPLLILSVVLMIRGLRKEKSIRPITLIFQALISVLLLIIYDGLLKIAPPTGWSVALFITGAIIGLLQSRTTRMSNVRGRVAGKRSAWYLVVWGISFSITQLLVLFGPSKAAAYGLLTIYLSTGLSMAVNGTLLVRYYMMKSHGETAAVICPNCGKEDSAERKFCTGCGKALPAEQEQAAGKTFCTKCGESLNPSQKFCTSCGHVRNK